VQYDIDTSCAEADSAVPCRTRASTNIETSRRQYACT